MINFYNKIFCAVRKLGALLIISFFVFGLLGHVYAADVSVKNTGFITSGIWYSKESFYAGETVRVYTAIFNGSAYELSGSVELLDNDTLVGKTTFSLLASGQVHDVSIPWHATVGKHIMTARIADASISMRGGPKTAIALENAQAGKSDLTIEEDPAVIAARAEAMAAKSSAQNSSSPGIVAGAVQTVSSAIPVSVKESTNAGIGAIDNFRASLAVQLEAAKTNKGKDIDALNLPKAIAQNIEKAKQNPGIINTVSSGAEKPLAYVVYGILAALQYFFEWRIIFYGVLLYALYRLIKWLIQKFRNR